MLLIHVIVNNYQMMQHTMIAEKNMVFMST